MVTAAAAVGGMAWGQSRVGEEADQAQASSEPAEETEVHQRAGRKAHNRVTGMSVSRGEGSFPSGPVAKTPSSQRRGPRFDPQLGN